MSTHKCPNPCTRCHTDDNCVQAAVRVGDLLLCGKCYLIMLRRKGGQKVNT